jgi:hypothetical protein
MSNIQTAHALIEQFSHAVGIPGLTLDEEGLITLRTGDDHLVQLAHDASSGELILSAEVHPDADTLPPSALRRMLVTNVKLHAEAGPAFAIAPGEGTVVLEHHLPLQDLEYSQFEEVWTKFLDQVERARTKLAHLVNASASSNDNPTQEGLPLPSEQLFILRA